MQPHPSILSETINTVGSPGPILRAMAKNWWVLLIRGIAAIAFGVLAFVLPGLTLLTLVTLYAIGALVDGVLSLVAASSASAGIRPDLGGLSSRASWASPWVSSPSFGRV